MSDSNTVIEKISFTASHEIERALPMLLADKGRMSVQTWDNFCDKVDETTKALRRVGTIKSIIWLLVVVCCVLLIFGRQWVTRLPAWYGICTPTLFVLLIVVCHIEGHTIKAVSSKISQQCAKASNHNKDLTMTLKGIHLDTWYIEVAVRNVMDIEHQPYAAAAVEAMPVADATAVPVADATTPPKKYVKDSEGKLTLNSEYKVWKLANS